jgi:hypothetical protein
MATALLPVIFPHVSDSRLLPALVLNAGNKTTWRFVEFLLQSSATRLPGEPISAL